jgi:hypothetical protein
MKPLMTIFLFTLLCFVFPPLHQVSGEETQSISAGPRVTKEQIKDRIGTPDFLLLDVRPSEQWRATQVKLPGAVHEDPEDVKAWAGKYEKNLQIVTY